MIRDPKFYALLGIAVLLSLILVVLLADRGVVAPPEPQPAPYSTGDRLEGTDPVLCIEDHTSGFPVAQAAAEFEGLVRMVVEDDCSGQPNAVLVALVIRDDESWSGWYNGPNPSRDGAALISLNVAEAFRLDARGWRMVLVHELGHAAGLDHTFEGESVMDPLDYSDHDGLTESDRRQLAEMYG
ncbi:matrixin family metalloprotease [Jiangella asiatica]|uniref:Matrixin family metalloprotease n=1 Tax=Jiangella asiatica TaxID=2530372 RepID=A0A4R5CIF7_9ACTN|nr:matrixin family metalloprotease [Jiangella asiatica]TDD98889.1 matrixin family metalloprotease [Jiangella asiatica]